jgi:serine/threonine protein kinase
MPAKQLPTLPGQRQPPAAQHQDASVFDVSPVTATPGETPGSAAGTTHRSAAQPRSAELDTDSVASSIEFVPEVRPVVVIGDYELRETIRREDGFIVKVGFHTKEHTLHEIRIYSLRALKNDPKLRVRVERDVLCLRNLSHPYIQRLDTVLYTPGHMYVVLEFCHNGDLLDTLLQQQQEQQEQQHQQPDDASDVAGSIPASPGVVARLFLQLMTAIAYLHSQGIVHRDIKLENLLLDKNNTLKLSNFHAAGAAADASAGSSGPGGVDHGRAAGPLSPPSSASPRAPMSALRSANFNFVVPCGSCHYVSPEVIRCAESARYAAYVEEQDPTASMSETVRPRVAAYDGRLQDVWSCGVVLFALSTGHLPFNGPSDGAVFAAILNRAFHGAAAPLLARQSPHLVALLDAMLDVNAATRITAGEVLQHPYWNAVPSAVRAAAAASRQASPDGRPAGVQDAAALPPTPQHQDRRGRSPLRAGDPAGRGGTASPTLATRPGGYAAIAAARRDRSASQEQSQPASHRRVARTVHSSWV